MKITDKRFLLCQNDGILAIKDTKGEFCCHTQLFNSEVRSEIFANDVVEALNGVEMRRKMVARVLQAANKALLEAKTNNPEAAQAIQAVIDAMEDEKNKIMKELRTQLHA